MSQTHITMNKPATARSATNASLGGAHPTTTPPASRTTAHVPVKAPARDIAVKPHAPVVYPVVKRSMDILLSMTALIILSPVMIVIALIIKLDDGGPVFFAQPRVGHNQRTFVMWKFRTMKTNAEELLKELERAEGEAGNDVMFKMKDDPRVTRCGKVLRRLSLDELPQLFNILIGTMTMIGPRPPLHREVDTFNATELRKLEVKPGLTGLWQVMGRSNLSWEESIRLDIHYVDNYNAAMDIKIFFKTFKVVLAREGAY